MKRKKYIFTSKQIAKFDETFYNTFKDILKGTALEKKVKKRLAVTRKKLREHKRVKMVNYYVQQEIRAMKAQEEAQEKALYHNKQVDDKVFDEPDPEILESDYYQDDITEDDDGSTFYDDEVFPFPVNNGQKFTDIQESVNQEGLPPNSTFIDEQYNPGFVKKPENVSVTTNPVLEENKLPIAQEKLIEPRGYSTFTEFEEQQEQLRQAKLNRKLELKALKEKRRLERITAKKIKKDEMEVIRREKELTKIQRSFRNIIDSVVLGPLITQDREINKEEKEAKLLEKRKSKRLDEWCEIAMHQGLGKDEPSVLTIDFFNKSVFSFNSKSVEHINKVLKEHKSVERIKFDFLLAGIVVEGFKKEKKPKVNKKIRKFLDENVNKNK